MSSARQDLRKKTGLLRIARPVAAQPLHVHAPEVSKLTKFRSAPPAMRLLRVAADHARERPVAAQPLHVHALGDDAALSLVLLVVLLLERREAIVVRHVDLLPARDLALRPAQGLAGGVALVLTGADRQEDLADVHTGDRAVGLAPRTTHTGLETICTSARQHLVDTNDVEGVAANAKVERFLTRQADHALVRRNTRSFEGLTGHLLVLVRHHVHCQGELIHVVLLLAAVENADLRVRDATAEPRLRVRLVLAVAVTAGRTTAHRNRACADVV